MRERIVARAAISIGLEWNGWVAWVPEGIVLLRQPSPDANRTIRATNVLGGVDGFDEDEAESKGHNGTVVLGRLLAAQRHALEALELAHKLLDAGTSPTPSARTLAGSWLMP